MIGRRMIAAVTVVAAVAAGGVAGALIGVPGLSGAAPTSSPSPNSSDAPDARGFRGHFGPIFGRGHDVLDAGAKALDLSTEDLLSKLSDGKTTIADVAKQQDVDVQTVIDAMDAVAKADITEMVNNPFPVPAKFPGLGFRFRGGLREDPINAAAKALGVTTEELLTELRDGKSIADIAKTKNVDVSTLIDTLVADAKTKLDAAVKAGDLTQDEANKLESALLDHITNLVNGTHPKREGRFGPRAWHIEPGDEAPAA